VDACEICHIAAPGSNVMRAEVSHGGIAEMAARKLLFHNNAPIGLHGISNDNGE
jgi:hypothetical protein